jgi:lycopene beta-cyclase
MLEQADASRSLIGPKGNTMQAAPVSEAPLLIIGGGLAGCLVALALAERRPGHPFLLIEAGPRFGGNQVWSFFDTDVEPHDRWLTALVRTRRWSDHEVHFPAGSRVIDIGYNSIRAQHLDEAVKQRLRPTHYRLNDPVELVAPDHVCLASGERLAGSAVLDMRGFTPVCGVALAWQKFVGLYCRIASGHGLQRPIVMDARVDQGDDYRFVYLLPFSPTELLIEDTYYSDEPGMRSEQVKERIRDFARSRGWGEIQEYGAERGVLPIILSGSVEAFWPDAEAGVARLGLRGGFFHPTTGYSLPDAIANAALLANQPDLSGPALYQLFRSRADRLWRRRGFYRLLNRMLFQAALPGHRYRVLQHFYRAPPLAIARFYAGQSSLLDKIGILSGRPPVPLFPAIKAMASVG